MYVVGITDKETAQPIISRFIQKLNELNIEELQGSRLEVSIGIAFYKKEVREDFESLYIRADNEVYNSKKQNGIYISYSPDYVMENILS